MNDVIYLFGAAVGLVCSVAGVQYLVNRRKGPALMNHKLPTFDPGSKS